MALRKMPLSYVFEAFEKDTFKIARAGSSDKIECLTLNHIWLVRCCDLALSIFHILKKPSILYCIYLLLQRRYNDLG
jgi:hypothetical protein